MTSYRAALQTAVVFLLATLLAAFPAFAQEKDKDKDKDKKPGLPLQAERTAEFTTDEGTWLSLDVAPGGQTIVFELLGDLYTLPMAGGEARALTSGMAFDSQPRYAPDGQSIAFVSDRDGAENVWVMPAAGGEPRQITKDKQASFKSPSWTPDGQYLLVTRATLFPRGPDDVWMYHVRGGSGVPVIKGRAKPDVPRREWAFNVGPVASPDGRYIYYTRRTQPDGFYNLEFPRSQIHRRDRTTGDDDAITDAPGSAFRPALSPDGHWLAFGTRHETQTGLRIRDLRTGEERWLAYPVQRDDQESLFTRDFLPGYAFTPDGSAIVVTYEGKIHHVEVVTGAARNIPFTAQVKQGLGPLLDFPARVDEEPVRARIIQAPVLSPDSKRLAFSALTQLYVMDLPSGRPRLLSAAGAREFQPAWSPDGQWLAYVTWYHGGGHIWKVRADGAQRQQLTTVPAYYRDVVWSPDGSRLVALRGRWQQRVELEDEWSPATGLDLVWLPAEGGDVNLILPARGAGRPHFARDDGRIYVHTPGGLVSLRFDGTDRRTHLKVVGKSPALLPPDFKDEIGASDIRLSPDGNWALATVHGQLYVLAAPVVGGDPPTVNVSDASMPLKKLTEVGVDAFAWADNGKTITWALGASLLRQPFNSVVFDPPKEKEDEGEAPAEDAPESSTLSQAGHGGAAPQESKNEAAKNAKKPPVEEITIAVEKPRHKPEGTLVLRGGTAVTMRGDEVIRNADIVITGNRITAVGARGSQRLPSDARVMDVRGATIVPGFIDTHAHWFEVRQGILDMQNWSFLANLAYGVTAGRDPQTMTNDMFAYQDLVEAGEMTGPRAFSTGPGIFSTNQFSSAEEALSVVSKYKRHYRTNTLKSYMVGNRQQRQWVVAASKEHKMMPTTEGGLDLKLNLTHMIDGFSGTEHSLPIVPLFKDVAELAARSGITYTPTLLVAYGGPWAENYFYQTTEVYNDPKLRRFIPRNLLQQKTQRRPWVRFEEHVFPQLAASAKKIVEAGGRVCIGSHGQLQGLGYHWEMWALASGGMSNHDVLRAATIKGAEAIGYAQDLGSIEPGKLADLVILARNPLQDIRNSNSVRYVVKNGEMFEGDTLNRLWPRRQPLDALWWWDEKP